MITEHFVEEGTTLTLRFSTQQKARSFFIKKNITITRTQPSS